MSRPLRRRVALGVVILALATVLPLLGSSPAEAAEVEVVPTVTRFRHHGCREPVQLLEVDGGGHTWPGGPVLPAHLGPTSDAIDATDAILDFFAAQ
jgi:poly(3-hydroxybutyrate) depolymerase